MKLLSLNKISYKYNETDASRKTLENISLEINEGEFVGIIGHTGSGKSTLIQTFNGLIKPDSGLIEFMGEDIYSKGYSLKKLRSQVALVFQYPDHQLFEETVLKDVMFGPKCKGLDEEAQKSLAIKSLEMVGINKEEFDKSPFELSGGQKKRVTIAGALAQEPKILVLDEPTAGLDPKGRKMILDEIKHLQESLGLAVVLVSHSMKEVADYVDRLYVINDGKILYDDLTQNIFVKTNELNEIGLDSPETIHILQSLKDKGFDVDTTKIKADEVANEIIKCIKK